MMSLAASVVVAALLTIAPSAVTLVASPAVDRSSAAADTTTLRRAVQARLDSLHAAGRFPGVNAAIVLADGSTLQWSAGVAERNSSTRLTPDSRFLAGSVGKTFFAALALQLAEEGRLDLDAPISRWLGAEPWFGRLPNAEAVTVRMLMNHTSGLVRYEFNPRVTELITAEPDHVWTPEERLSYLFDTQASFAAGDGWEYSDTNYIVLGMILERITGTPAYDEIHRRFIVPLALTNTVPSDRRVIPGLVQGYAGADNPFGRRDEMLENGRFIMNPQMEWAGGGYASSPADLARWARALYSGRFHGREIVAAMLDAVPARGLGQNVGYGLGVIVRTTDLGPAWGHSGFFPGYLTEVRYYPEHDMAVAVQFNTSVARDIGRNTGAVVHDLAQLAIRR